MINITYQSSNAAVAKIVLADVRIRIGSSLTCPCSELCLGHQGVKRAAPFSMAEQALRNFLSHVESNCRVFLFDEDAFPRMVCYNMQGSPSSAVLGLRLKRSRLVSQCYFDCSEVACQASFIFHAMHLVGDKNIRLSNFPSFFCHFLHSSQSRYPQLFFKDL